MRRLTKFAVRSASVAALLALSLVAPTPARADGVPVSGTIDSTPVPSDSSLRTFTGNVTPFGQIAGILQLHIDQSTGAYTGQFVLVARGGRAYGTIQGQFLSASTYLETLTFTGGTGMYNSIFGSATVYGVLNPATGAGVDTVLPGGQIYLPR